MPTLTAQQFNEKYPVGSVFNYQEFRPLCVGQCKTVDIAKDVGWRIVVAINVYPYYVSIESLIKSQ